MKTWTILILAYGQEETGELKPETKDRCLAAVRRYVRLVGLGRKCLLFVANTSAKMVGDQAVLMGEEMYKYLVHQPGVSYEDVFYTAREGVFGGENTGGEIDSVLEFLRHRHWISLVCLGFATTWYHVPRVFYLLLMRGWWPWPICIAWRYFEWVGDVLVEFGPPLGRYGKFWKNLILPYYSVRRKV